MKPVKVHTPFSSDTISSLKAGMLLHISGTLYTARDQAHKNIAKLIEQHLPLPIDLLDAVIYYTGPSPAPNGMVIGAVGPTTSYRMDSYTPMMLSLGAKVFIGKGPRSELVKKLLVQHRAIYCSSFGGAAAYLNQCVVDATIVAFPELGPEAIYRLTVKDFPAVIINDIYGGDLYESTFSTR